MAADGAAGFRILVLVEPPVLVHECSFVSQIPC